MNLGGVRPDRRPAKEGASAPPEGTAYNCPAEAPFLKTIASAMLSGELFGGRPPEQHELPAIFIYVPVQGAVDPLKQAFLDLAPNRATLLPRIRILGQIDPVESFAAFAPKIRPDQLAIELLQRATAVPPAFGPLERQLILSSLVSRSAAKLKSETFGEPLYLDITPAGAFRIAGRIAGLIDEIQKEGAELDGIFRLGLSDGSTNEQLSLRLLQSVLKEWKAHKAQSGKIDPEERNNAFTLIEAEFIKHSDVPVIVAGSTGSVAATCRLMEAALARKGNAIVLPGLDRHLDEESWNDLGRHPEHPQHGLHRLLARLGVSRKEVKELLPATSGRSSFLSEAMRPASSASAWHEFLEKRAEQATELTVIEAENLQQEAEIISLILREALETPRQTAAFVTADDKLAQRVRHLLARWGLSADDADENAMGRFAARVASCAASGKAYDLVSLLRHAPSGWSETWRRFAELMDLGALRQMWRPQSFKDIPAALTRAAHAVKTGDSRHPAMKRIREEEWEAARLFAGKVIHAFAPLLESAHLAMPLRDWLSAHQEVLSRLAEIGQAGVREEDRLFDAFAAFKPPAISLDLAAYAQLFAELAMAGEKQAVPDVHPRLRIWRPLDARLLSTDVIVLGGLNEGCWPQNLEPDPWLTRQDREFLGLSAPERRIGRSAHDFACLAAAGARVYLTRSRVADGSLARPSRWLSRIRILASGAGSCLSADGAKWLNWARMRLQPEKVMPAPCPEPKPPLAVRPRRLSVTAMETWFANPYAIYARHILGLEPLRAFSESGDARDRGILIHAALHKFFERHKSGLPADAAERLLEEFDRAAREAGFDLAFAPLWRPRFWRFAQWLVASESAQRDGLSALKSEVAGRLTLPAPAGEFEITARADRIDVLSGGALRIYDYKTSANAAQLSLRRGAPQLALEGLIAREGGFTAIRSTPGIEAAYIIATGGEPPGEIKPLKPPMKEAIESALVGTLGLIARFDDPETPYRYVARAIFQDKAENDPYAHLARVQEWTTEGAMEGDGDE